MPKKDQAPSSIQSIEILIKTPGSEDQIYRLGQGLTSIGRADDADLELNYPWFSKKHLEIEVKPGGGCFVKDLGSTNGTKLLSQGSDEILEKNAKYQVKITQIFFLTRV
jgi:pSer/pThr/pTyr-binding forkhead associated (FHA) protein